jgi:hypothetical protein
VADGFGSAILPEHAGALPGKYRDALEGPARAIAAVEMSTRRERPSYPDFENSKIQGAHSD